MEVKIGLSDDPTTLREIVRLVGAATIDWEQRFSAAFLVPASLYCGFTIVARDDGGRVVGYNCVLATREPHEFFFSQIMVDDDFRNRGIGADIHHAAETECACLGATRLLATALPTNLAILKLLLNRFGWRAFDFKRGLYGPSQSRLLLEKRITQERREVAQQSDAIDIPLDDDDAISAALVEASMVGARLVGVGERPALTCVARSKGGRGSG
ncbi:MAG TPA: GNAT family N-acetyltransferase [Phycisphaerae bacterium]|nr:GNAT family N-acetyltransferase [Phycisphaerae bacterium]